MATITSCCYQSRSFSRQKCTLSWHISILQISCLINKYCHTTMITLYRFGNLTDRTPTYRTVTLHLSNDDNFSETISANFVGVRRLAGISINRLEKFWPSASTQPLFQEDSTLALQRKFFFTFCWYLWHKLKSCAIALLIAQFHRK